MTPPLVSVAFEITADNYVGDAVDHLSALAELVEHVLREELPDHMIRRLDPDGKLDEFGNDVDLWR